MRSDIEIAQACPLQHIRDIAREAGIRTSTWSSTATTKPRSTTAFCRRHQGRTAS